MLKIKKSKIKEEWILYNPQCFETCHTHCRHKRVALKIKYLVEHRIMPISMNKSFVESCIRVAGHGSYRRRLEGYMDGIKVR